MRRFFGIITAVILIGILSPGMVAAQETPTVRTVTVGLSVAPWAQVSFVGIDPLEIVLEGPKTDVQGPEYFEGYTADIVLEAAANCPYNIAAQWLTYNFMKQTDPETGDVTDPGDFEELTLTGDLGDANGDGVSLGPGRANGGLTIWITPPADNTGTVTHPEDAGAPGAAEAAVYLGDDEQNPTPAGTVQVLVAPDNSGD